MEIAIISEDTVKVLDRYVHPGAGKWAVRCLFLVIIALVVSVIWSGLSAAWHAATWIDSAEAAKAVTAFTVGRAVNTLLRLFIVVFLVATGIPVTVMVLNGLAWTWRNADLATGQIVLAWQEASSIKRLSFALIMLFAATVLLSSYLAVMYVALHGLGGQK